MDLNLLSLARSAEQDLFDQPGLHIAAVPRRLARGRQPDRLILYFLLEGNAPLTTEQQDQILKRLAQTYYNTPGSVTAAMRSAAEGLNQYLLDRNLRGASSGQQSVGLLALVTLRNDRLYLGACGPMQAILINAEQAQVYADPQSTHRGLGLGRTTSIYYAQSAFAVQDTLVISSQPAAAWNPANLGGLHGQSPESVRHRLMALAGSDQDGFLLQARPGSGKTFLLRPKPASAAPQSPVTTPVAAPAKPMPAVAETIPPAPAPPASLPARPAAAPVPMEDLMSNPPGVEDGAQDLPVAEPVLPPRRSAAQEWSSQPQPQTAPPATEAAAPDRPRPDRRQRRRPSGPSAPGVVGTAFRTTLAAFLRGLGTLLTRMLPNESLLTLPPAVMALTAVIVPLVVVTVASVVYFQRGQAGQYQAIYAQAVQAASAARSQTDPASQRAAWKDAIQYLTQARAFGSSQDADELLIQANLALDSLDRVQRLDFQPALADGLPSGAKIVQIIATTSDLYMLDASNGSVWRAFTTGRGYEIDTGFQCGAGYPTSGGIGPLLDITTQGLPSSPTVSILGMDAAGNSLECSPGAEPSFRPLLTPYTGWDTPSALTQDQGVLYVMDRGKRAVWIYANLGDPPRPFFTGDTPDLADAVDLAVLRNDLYLLHNDGRVSLCTFTGMEVSPTQCSPLTFTDSRPGLEGQVLTPQMPFLQLVISQPPDPSLYLLEAGTQALYHYSLRLTFQEQFSPASELTPAPAGQPEPATAFTITPDKRVAILAVADQVFYAGLP